MMTSPWEEGPARAAPRGPYMQHRTIAQIDADRLRFLIAQNNRGTIADSEEREMAALIRYERITIKAEAARR
jgi:hypothetical protein